MFRFLRIAILLTILVIVAGNQWLTGSRLSSWDRPLWVTIYPVLVDSDEDVLRYVESLEVASFGDINAFFVQQTKRYGVSLDYPVFLQLARPLTTQPPDLPVESSGLNVALWSLKMRWWSWRNSGQDGLISDHARIYVLYQKGDPNTLLERSVGVKNGSYGIVNALASRKMTARNNIVISHELLHILGATDKYDLYTGQPVAPDGLASPAQSPLYPQERAEIMGGRIATSGNRWRRPPSLKYCVVGSYTAAEIGWIAE
jgi:hypothetical protein